MVESLVSRLHGHSKSVKEDFTLNPYALLWTLYHFDRTTNNVRVCEDEREGGREGRLSVLLGCFPTKPSSKLCSPSQSREFSSMPFERTNSKILQLSTTIGPTSKNCAESGEVDSSEALALGSLFAARNASREALGTKPAIASRHLAADTLPFSSSR